MTTGASLGVTATTFGIGESTATNTFHTVLFLLIVMLEKLIRFPGRAEVATMIALMRRRGIFAPTVLFIIDGTHTELPHLKTGGIGPRASSL